MITQSIPLVTITLLGLLAGQGLSQSPAKAPPITASIVPIGANSDSYWVGDGPGMRAVALDPDAAPPSTWCVKTRDGFTTIPATLNRPSIALPVSGGTLRVFANQEVSAEGEPPSFGNYQIPTTPGHYDIFLNRASKEKGWDKAESMVLPAATTSFPNGSFRLINLSAEPIKARIGKTTIDLAPRRAKILQPAEGATGKLLTVQAANTTGSPARQIIRTGIRLSNKQRANLIFYPGRDPKKPCKATWFYQSDPAPPSTETVEEP